MRRIANIASLFLFPLLLLAQSSPPKLELEEIMKGDEFVGALPSNLNWSVDSRYLYFQRDTNFDGIDEWFTLDTTNWQVNYIQPEDENEMKFYSYGQWNTDYSLQTYTRNGNLWLYNKNSDHHLQVSSSEEAVSQAGFARQDSLLIFRKSNNLFSWNRFDGTLKQITDIREKKAPQSDEKGDFYQKQQKELFEIVRKQDERRKTNEELQKRRKSGENKPFYLNSRSIRHLTSSHSTRYVGLVVETSSPQKNTEMPRYVGDTGYTNHRKTRSKVGEEKNYDELFIYSSDLDSFVEVDLEKLPGIFDNPEYLKDYPNYEGKWTEIKQVKIQGPFFHPSQELCFVVIRSQENKDRWIAMVDLTSFELELIQHDHDEAWIGGPGVSSWNGSAGNVGWLRDQAKIYFQSEETGYSHLYLYDLKKEKTTALTSGDWEVLDIFSNFENGEFFIQANKENPFEQHIYQLEIESKNLTKLTDQPGKYDFFRSPNGQWNAFLFSQSIVPTEIVVQDAEGKEVFKSASTTAAFQSYPWKQPEIIYFKASDGVEVPARLYRPAESRGGPAVIFVHGAGYLQNVHRWWSSYFREYMFHNMLVDQGFTVLDIDYRGSAGYGRDWRTAIYRYMGGRDLQDQVDGARYLVEELGVNKEKIGIYGGSYGGFITLMALFNEPQVFKAGAALRSVTDWAHYNQGYTSNILNLPTTDSIAYRRSSPIYFAEGLENRLLMLHGMEDDNVHFQDIIRLTQILIELKKENWELAVYPIEPHGFKEYTSWLDEYRRIYKMFKEELGE